MRIPRISITKYSISDLEEETTLKLRNNLSKLRKEVDILIIDDQCFPAEDYLKQNGYQLCHKNDLDNLRDVMPYDIIMCDISGVGGKLGFEKEGAYIIKEIHNQYPNKRIIAYTANTFNAEYNNYFSLADIVGEKDTSIDNWIDIIDQQILNVTDPIKQWDKIKQYFFDHNVSTIRVAEIENKFVESIKKKNMNIVQSFVEGTEKKYSSVIANFLTSVCVKIIIGTIAGGII